MFDRRGVGERGSRGERAVGDRRWSGAGKLQGNARREGEQKGKSTKHRTLPL
jgi:hypothetical protein